MRQFRVLESTDGVTIDATISVDANSPAFTGTELAEIYLIDDPRSSCGIRARQAARERMITMCEDIVVAVSCAEQAALQSRELATDQEREAAYCRGETDSRKEAEAKHASNAATIASMQTRHVDDFEVIKTLRSQLATFQQSEAQRAHLAQSRRNQRAAQRQKPKTSTAKPAHKRKQ